MRQSGNGGAIWNQYRSGTGIQSGRQRNLANHPKKSIWNSKQSGNTHQSGFLGNLALLMERLKHQSGNEANLTSVENNGFPNLGQGPIWREARHHWNRSGRELFRK